MTDIKTLLGLLNDKLTPKFDIGNEIPAPLILSGARLKNGLSARKITSEIITDRQKIDIPIGALPDGGESIDEKMEYLRIERIVSNLIQNAKITVVIPPGIPVTATGLTAAGVPVTVQGTTVNFATGHGIIQ